MKRKRRSWVAAFLVGGLLLITITGTVFAQTNADGMYFPETGHWVRGEFLSRYTSVEDPGLIYGLPITDAFVDQDKGRTIQYFQYAQFELHPEESGENRVQLTPLGEFTYVGGEKVHNIPNPTSCRFFGEYNQWVCYEFLTFFEDHGGVEQFGYPISGFEFNDEVISQYFQYARLEWHPELDEGNHVRLGPLGREYFTIRNEDRSLLHPQIVDETTNLGDIESLRLFVFVDQSVMHSGGEQTYYVIVQDQNRKPVPGARVVMNITLPDGSVDKFNLPPSNTKGLSISPPLAVTSEEKGTAYVDISTEVDGIEASARTSYFIWW